MNDDELVELAGIAALGALDGAERDAFQARLALSPRLAAEFHAFERVAAALPLALPPVRPTGAARARLLEAADPDAGAVRPAPRRTRSGGLRWLAAAAVLLLAAAALVLRAERDQARREARLAEQQRDTQAEARAGLARELEQARLELAQGRSVRRLLDTPRLLVVDLAGQAPAAGAHARALVDPGSRRALLLVRGLERAPAGKAYEVWVIAGPAPTAAGTFQVAEDGSAVVALPVLDETARARSFAVSLEPAEGVASPTGPIVLAGGTP